MESFHVIKENLSQVDRIASQIEKLAKKDHYLEGSFYANYQVVQIFRDFPKELTAARIRKIDLLVQKNRESLHDTLMISYYLFKGYRAGGIGEYLTELNYFLKADKLFKKNYPIRFRRRINTHLCIYSLDIGDIEKALQILEGTLKTFNDKNEKDSSVYQLTLYNMGYLYNKLNNYTKSVEMIKRSFDEGLINSEDLKSSYAILADSYVHLNEMDSASLYLNKSSLFDTSEVVYSIDQVLFLQTAGNFYSANEMYEDALVSYNKALMISDSVDFVSGKINNLEKVIINLALLNDLPELVQQFKLFKDYKDSIYLRNSHKIEYEYQVKYETAKKQARISELKKQRKIDKYLLYLILTGFVLSVVIIILIILRYKSRQTNLNQQITIQNIEKEQVKLRLKHREGELASSINSLEMKNQVIDDLKESISSEKNIEEILQVFEQSYISDIEWQKIIRQFEAVYRDFITEIKTNTPSLSVNDIRLIILLKLSYSNPAITSILNISLEGVKKAKQRLKKKIGEKHPLFQQ